MSKLNTYQEAVARWRPEDGNLRVTSGAGSGKTTTLVELVARLLHSGIPASAIVVTTFTNKTASEILARIVKRVGYHPNGLRIGTYHSLALRYFGQNAAWRFRDGANIDGREGVHVAGVHGALRSLKLWRLILTRGPVPGTGGTGLQIKRADPFEYSGWASRLGSSELHPAVVLDGTTLDDITQLPKFTAAWSTYERAKKAIKACESDGTLICNGVWDFADVLAGWNSTLRKEGVGILGRVPNLGDAASEAHGIKPWDVNKGTIVVVDEAQDNTPRQWKLSRRIATPYGRIVAVGDESQSIYAFRGAKPARFLDAAETLLAATLDLPVNYRSGRRIVALGNAIVADADWRVGALTQAATEDLGKVTWSCSQSPDDEAYELLMAVQAQIASGVRPQDIGVLCRTNTYAFRIAIMLGMYGVPVRPMSRQNLMAQPEIAAFVGWVQAVQKNAVIPPSIFRAMLNLPQSYLPRKLRDELAQAVTNEGIDQAIRRVRQQSTKAYQKRSFDSMKARITDLRVYDWPDVCDAVGKLVSTESGVPKKSRTRASDVIEEFGGGTTDGDADGKGKGILVVLARLAAFFPNIGDFAMQLAKVDQQFAADKGANKPGVAVGTIHSAKGLEWSVVYGPGISAGVFPSALTRTKADEEEERRLLYVLVTRAADEIHLSGTDAVYRAGKLIASGPSTLAKDFILPWMEEPTLADVYDAAAPIPTARPGKLLEAAVVGAKVAIDVGAADGVRPALLAGAGAMVRELLTPDTTGGPT